MNLQKFLFRKNQSIDPFQLENLLSQQAPFIAYCLLSEEGAGKRFSAALARAKVKFSPEISLKQIVSENSDREYPVILICRTGWKSNWLAHRLENRGYKNIFVLEGGLQSTDLL